LPTTPNLDKLATQGCRLDQMVSASSWTMPSVGTMFTGLHPSQHNITNSKSCFAKGITTLAAEFRKAGYHTAAITSNPLVHSKFGYSKGFEIYDDFTVMLAADLDIFGDASAADEPNAALGRGGVTSPMVNRFANRFLAGQQDATRPFFLFLLYFDPHGDYVPPAPYNTMFGNYGVDLDIGANIYSRGPDYRYTDAERKQLVSLYDGEIRNTDEHIGQLLANLDRLKLGEDTIVIVLADHGEEFWDHGSMLHGDTLYEEQVHVPCIVRYPGRVPPGTVLRHQASHLDVMPTLLSLAGVPIPDQCMGRSLAPVLRDPKTPLQPRIAFLETNPNHHTDLKAARLPARKLIHDRIANTHLAFDLAADPLEKQPIDTPPFSLLGSLDQWSNHMETAQSRDRTGASAPARLDQEHLRILRALGYLR
jgi:arylsulfatase A-like enzyme